MRQALASRGGWRAWACAALLPPLVAAALIPLRGTALNLVSDALVLLVTVVGAALVGGLLPGVVAAVWATMLLNFLFIPPYGTHRVTDPNNLVALLVFALVAGLVSWAVDQSVRRRDEATRAATAEAADRVRAALLTAVGHDLRTPLAGVKASVSGLLSDDVHWSDQDRRELLESADASVDRLAALVENLLDLSRVQAGAMPVRVRPTAVDEVVAAALDALGDGPPVYVDVPEELPEVYADPGLLERVIANLVTNAVRFSPADAPPSISVQVRDGHHLDLRITDHGPGIAASQRDALFRPFQRLGDHTNTEGLGLGLALARGLAEAMDAEITPDETAGGGLTMVVSLKVVT